MFEEKKMVVGNNPLKPPGSRPRLIPSKWRAVLPLTLAGITWWLPAMFVALVASEQVKDRGLEIFAFTLMWVSLFVSFIPVYMLVGSEMDWRKVFRVSKWLLFITCLGSFSGCSMMFAAQ